jgi:hypothetical protein
MADKKVVAPLVEEPETEEEEYYAQYVFENCTFNITMAENSQLNIGVGKPAPFPPPKG